jgi:hypothetical protein
MRCFYFIAMLAVVACGGGGSSVTPAKSDNIGIDINMISLKRTTGDTARLDFSFSMVPRWAGPCRGWVDWWFYVYNPQAPWDPWEQVATARLPDKCTPDSYTIWLNPGVEWQKVTAALKVSVPKEDLIIKTITYKEEP